MNAITYRLLLWFVLAHQFVVFIVGSIIAFALTL
jgi:hypothetical protein